MFLYITGFPARDNVSIQSKPQALSLQLQVIFIPIAVLVVYLKKVITRTCLMLIYCLIGQA